MTSNDKKRLKTIDLLLAETPETLEDVMRDYRRALDEYNKSMDFGSEELMGSEASQNEIMANEDIGIAIRPLIDRLAATDARRDVVEKLIAAAAECDDDEYLHDETAHLWGELMGTDRS